MGLGFYEQAVGFCKSFAKSDQFYFSSLGFQIEYLAIFTFIASWNDYFSQLIFTNSEMMKTLPLGVAAMAQSAEFSLNYGLLMAGALLASLPMIIVFLMFQNYFTQGVTMGAVKG